MKSLPFPVPPGYVYDTLSRSMVCDLQPGDVVRIGENWHTVLSLRASSAHATHYKVATHEFVTDEIHLNTFPNAPEHIFHVYRRRHSGSTNEKRS